MSEEIKVKVNVPLFEEKELEILDRLNFVKLEPNKLSYYPEDLLTKEEIWLLLDYITDLQNQNKEQKEVLDKIKEYITTIDTDYAIGCWNKDEEFVDVKKDILELLEEIE